MNIARKGLPVSGIKSTVLKFSFIFPVSILGLSVANATTLTEAVNNQLKTISLPCENLLGGDSFTVLTGKLETDICSRAVPAGANLQDTSSSPANANINQDATQQLLEHVRNKHKPKQGEFDKKIDARWTIFATAEGGVRNRDVSSETNGYNSHIINLLAGTTYALNANHTLGAAIALQRHTGDYVGGGDFRDSVSGVRLLETYHPSAAYYLQAVAGIDSVASKYTRYASFTEYDLASSSTTPLYQTTGTPSADYNYKQTMLSVLGGYTLHYGSMTLTPQLGVDYQYTDYGTYAESGTSGLQLVYHNDKRKSLQSSLGFQLTNNVSTKFGVMIPQLDISWRHEFADKSRQVAVSFVEDTRGKIFYYNTEAADRDFFTAGAGLSFVYAHGIQSFVRAQAILGQRYYHSYSISLGLNIPL